MRDGAPSAILRPDSSTTTRLQRFITKSTLCSMMMSATPSSLSFRIAFSILRIIVGFTPATGSSRITSFGLAIIVAAIASSLRWP